MSVFLENSLGLKTQHGPFFQVFRALENVSIDRDKFPNVFSWLNIVAAFPEEERSKWRPMKKSEPTTASKSRPLIGGRKLSFDD